MPNMEEQGIKSNESGKDEDSDGKGSMFSGMPWYVKAIALVGVPSLISIMLVWSIQIRLVDTVVENRASLIRMDREATEHDLRVTSQFNSLTAQSSANERLLRMICYGVSKTEESKQGCWK